MSLEIDGNCFLQTLDLHFMTLVPYAVTHEARPFVPLAAELSRQPRIGRPHTTATQPLHI